MKLIESIDESQWEEAECINKGGKVMGGGLGWWWWCVCGGGVETGGCGERDRDKP